MNQALASRKVRPAIRIGEVGLSLLGFAFGSLDFAAVHLAKNLFAQAQTLRSGFLEFVGGDVFDRSLQGELQGR